MSLKWRIFLFTSSIIYYNGDEDLPSVLFSDSGSLLDILVLDPFVVVVNLSISYKGGVLAFLAATITSKFLFYLMLCNRCYFTFSF